MDKSFRIDFPFVPDMVSAWAFKTCILCEEKKKKDPSFKNDSCIHCENKIFHWMKGYDNTKESAC